MGEQGRAVRPVAEDGASEFDAPSHGWFAVDLRHVLDGLERGRREAMLARIADPDRAGAGGAEAPERFPRTRPPRRPARSTPPGQPRRVPDEDIVVVGRDPAQPRPAGEVVPYPQPSGLRGLPRRTLALAVLLGLSLVGLTVQLWPPPPPIIIPVSLDERVIVT